MSNFKNVGTFDAGVFTPKMSGASQGGVPTMDAAGIASGGCLLVSELEKRDPLIRKPLTSFTYPRDINTISAAVGRTMCLPCLWPMALLAETAPLLWLPAGANGLPVIQASVDKGTYKAHVFAAALRVLFQDMQRANMIGRSLDQLLTDGMRMAYDKHMDRNVYMGMSEYDTTGLVITPMLWRPPSPVLALSPLPNGRTRLPSRS